MMMSMSSCHGAFNIPQKTLVQSSSSSSAAAATYNNHHHYRTPWIWKRQNFLPKTSQIYSTKIVDAEFTTIDSNNNNSERTTITNENNINDTSEQDQRETSHESKESLIASKSLFDLSFELDREFMESRIPFLDTTVPTTTTNSDDTNTNLDGSSKKNNYIDVKLAFMVTLDDAQYGIGIPYDTAAAITYEQPDGTIEYISPDTIVRESNNDNDDDTDSSSMELIAIMATQLQEHVGNDLQLQHTPRVLTIVGPIDTYTKDWKTTLIPKPINATDLVDALRNNNDIATTQNSDENQLDYFHEFMKKELGQEEYDKTMNEDIDIDDDDNIEMKEMLKLFQVPGLSNNIDDDDNDNDDSMNELFSTLLTPEKEYEYAKEKFGLLEKVEQDGYAALKLISYMFANGKSYSLVQLLQPYVIVGKYVIESSEDNDDDDNDNNYNQEVVGHFELLLPEEEQLIIPQLETICYDDLQKANLRFQKNTTTTTITNKQNVS
jgi:hypothetical protein